MLDSKPSSVLEVGGKQEGKSCWKHRPSFLPYPPECVEKLSEKPHEYAKLLAIRRVLAT